MFPFADCKPQPFSGHCSLTQKRNFQYQKRRESSRSKKRAGGKRGRGPAASSTGASSSSSRPSSVPKKVCSCVMGIPFSNHTLDTPILSLSLSLSLSHPHFVTHSLTYSLTHSHTHIHTLSCFSCCAAEKGARRPFAHLWEVREGWLTPSVHGHKTHALLPFSFPSVRADSEWCSSEPLSPLFLLLPSPRNIRKAVCRVKYEEQEEEVGDCDG